MDKNERCGAFASTLMMERERKEVLQCAFLSIHAARIKCAFALFSHQRNGESAAGSLVDVEHIAFLHGAFGDGV